MQPVTNGSPTVSLVAISGRKARDTLAVKIVSGIPHLHQRLLFKLKIPLIRGYKFSIILRHRGLSPMMDGMLMHLKRKIAL